MVSEEDIISCFGIYDKLGKKTKELLIKNAYKKSFLKGMQLSVEYRGALLCVKKGAINVFSVGENGGAVFLYKLQKEDCMIVKGAKEYEFATGTELIILDRAYVGILLSSGHTAENFLLKAELKTQENIINQFNMIMFTSLDARLSGFLLDAGMKSHGHPISFTHEQIARFIGSSREVVSRKLKLYEEEGILEVGRGKVYIKNRDFLKKKRDI